MKSAFKINLKNLERFYIQHDSTKLMTIYLTNMNNLNDSYRSKLALGAYFSRLFVLYV